jgi:predicted transcriptional regulator
MIKIIYTNQQRQLAQIAKALSRPIRVYIIDILSKQSCCYSNDLSEELPIAKSTLTQHFTELKKAGLIQGEIETPKVRYCQNKGNWEIAKKSFENFSKNNSNSKICS